MMAGCVVCFLGYGKVRILWESTSYEYCVNLNLQQISPLIFTLVVRIARKDMRVTTGIEVCIQHQNAVMVSCRQTSASKTSMNASKIKSL